MTLSPSHKALRVLIATLSVGLALLAAFATPAGTLVGAGILIFLTPFVALDPASRLTALLLALHGANWLSSTEVPADVRDWALTGITTVALLTIHLAAALAAALPPAAPLPRATLLRWTRRGLTVIGLALPVWVLLVAQSTDAPSGVPVITYAALASVATLALAFVLARAQDRPRIVTAPGAERR
ncbi:hypothetical protein V6K52_07545 [Knoellia sp. S7-12]|uniref:hypothetical protein n=1 Tax=Knoellia sp. S7-12 TaxID=3126698 RepID=UPI003367EB0B